MTKYMAAIACLVLGLAGFAMADQTTQGFSVGAQVYVEGVTEDLGKELDADYFDARGRFSLGYAKGDWSGLLRLEIGDFDQKPYLGTDTARDARIIEVETLYIKGPLGPATVTAGIQEINLGLGTVMSEDYVALNLGVKNLGLAYVVLNETMFADADVSALALYYDGTFGSVSVKPYVIYANFQDNYSTFETSAGMTAYSGDGYLFWIGLPLSMTMGPLSIDAEFDYLGGAKSDLAEISEEFRDVDYDSYAIFVKAAYDLGKAKIYAEAGYGTGDQDPTDDENTAFTPIDEDVNIDLVWEDNFGTGLTNLTFARLAADFSATEALTIGGAVVFEQFSEGVDKGIGTELDVTGSYAVTESATLSAGFGYLFAGDALDDDMYHAYCNVEFNY